MCLTAQQVEDFVERCATREKLPGKLISTLVFHPDTDISAYLKTLPELDCVTPPLVGFMQTTHRAMMIYSPAFNGGDHFVEPDFTVKDFH